MATAFFSIVIFTCNCMLRFSGCVGEDPSHCPLGTLTETVEEMTPVYSKELAIVTSRLLQCTSKVQSLEERLEQLDHDFREEKMRHETELEELRRELANNTSQLKMLKEDFVEIHADIDALNASSELQLSKDVLSPFLDPLESQITNINNTVNSLQNPEVPLGHVHGNGSEISESGEFLVNWIAEENATNFPLILKDEMEFVNSSFVVTKTGLYYVYAQLDLKPRRPPQLCLFVIIVNRDFSASAGETFLTESGNENTVYTGAVHSLSEGDIVSVFGNDCVFGFSPLLSFFGLFFLVE